jgi:excisionase family DNA binding protein
MRGEWLRRRAWSIGRIDMDAATGITPTGIGAERMPIATALLVTVEQAAQSLQVSRSSLYREVRRGRLRVVKLGHLTRIRQEDLQVYVAALAPPSR